MSKQKKLIAIGWTWITSSGYRTMSVKKPRHKSIREKAREVYMYEEDTEQAKG